MAHDALKNYSVQQIAQSLTKMGIEESKPEKINGKTQKLRLLPVWKGANYGKTDTLDNDNPFLPQAVRR